jgi:hypothetical protein
MPHSKLPRNVKPGPSNGAADKLYACMNYRTGRGNKKDAGYLKAPLYYDACWDWYQGLTKEQKDWALYTIDNFTAFGEEQAKHCAARLPPAPRCPL